MFATIPNQQVEGGGGNSQMAYKYTAWWLLPVMIKPPSGQEDGGGGAEKLFIFKIYVGTAVEGEGGRGHPIHPNVYGSPIDHDSMGTSV